MNNDLISYPSYVTCWSITWLPHSFSCENIVHDEKRNLNWHAPMYSLHFYVMIQKISISLKKIWITIAEIFRTRHLIINRLSYLKGPCWCFKLLSFREWAQELFLYWKGRSRIAAVRILCFTSWCLDFNFTPCLKKARIVFCSFGFLTLSAWAGGGHIVPPLSVFWPLYFNW